MCRHHAAALPLPLTRAVEHPSVPESPEFVRVRSYESQMVIRPHKSFDEVSFTSLKRWHGLPGTLFFFFALGRQWVSGPTGASRSTMLGCGLSACIFRSPQWDRGWGSGNHTSGASTVGWCTWGTPRKKSHVAEGQSKKVMAWCGSIL